MWHARRQVIRADHRAEGARTEAWKERLKSKGGGAGAAGPAKGAAMAVADDEIQYDDE